MLNAVIIDDEPLIREGLCVILDWENIGYKVVGVADNGINGYNLILKTKADVAIVDIMMPDITGIELAQMLKDNHVNCKIIFLTAYADFEYAKKSIELDVYSYILKPLEERELVEKLISIRDIIQKEQKVHKITKEKILEKVVRGDKDIINNIRNLYYEQIDIIWTDYQLIILEILNNDDNNMAFELSELITEEAIFYNNWYVFQIDGYFGILTSQINIDKLFRTFTLLQMKLHKKLKVSSYIYVGDAVQSIENISKTYDTIKKYMSHQFLFNYKNIIHCSSVELSKIERNEKQISYEIEDLYNAICINHVEDINRMLDELKGYYISKLAKEEYIKLSYYNLFTQIYTLIKTRIPELKNIISDEKDTYNQIHKVSSLQELHGLIKYRILFFANEIMKLGLDTPIAKIIDYISRNYDKDLKIEKIAEIMHYSSSYIGKMIKAELGENFNTYLNHKRIEKSKELLILGIKVSEVAERVGYKDCSLYNMYFKRITGYTPSEFKKVMEKY